MFSHDEKNGMEWNEVTDPLMCDGKLEEEFHLETIIYNFVQPSFIIHIYTLHIHLCIHSTHIRGKYSSLK